MFKRLINFLLLANGITPAGHKERDKWARLREDRERWEREQAANADESTPDRSPEPAEERRAV